MTATVTLEALVTQLRALGVAEYSGPVAEIGNVTLKLGPLPAQPEPEQPVEAKPTPSVDEKWAAVEKRIWPEG